jgi:hypothetical protein
MSSYPAPRRAPYRRGSVDSKSGGSGALVKVIALMLGLAVGVLAITAVVLMQAADEARDEAKTARAEPFVNTQDHSSHEAATTGAVSLPLQSFAGKTGADSEALAKAHAA